MSVSYLVTGATGHLGYNIVRSLYQKGCRIRALVLPEDPNAFRLAEMAQIFYGDITDRTTLDEFFDCPSTDEIQLIHCGALLTLDYKFNQEVWDVNVIGTKNILDLASSYHVSRRVFVTGVSAIPLDEEKEVLTETNDYRTDKVVGIYAKTMAAAGSLVTGACENGLNASLVLPSVIIGPYDYGQTYSTQLIEEYLNGRVPLRTDGGCDLVDVRDVAETVINCLETGEKGESYILSNQFCKVKELYRILHELGGVREVRLSIPGWMMKSPSPVTGVWQKNRKRRSLSTTYSKHMLKANAHFSHEKADQQLGYRVRDIRETLQDTVEFLRSENRA